MDAADDGLGIAHPVRHGRVGFSAAIVALVSAALAYPFLLKLFHWAIADAPVGFARLLIATVALALAFAVPIFGIALLVRLGGIADPTRSDWRMRRVALLGVATPPLFVFFGVGLGLLGTPVRDTTLWVATWLAALVYAAVADRRPAVHRPLGAPWRVTHGAIAAILSVYIVFHLGNHLIGLMGPAVHARVMEAGRTVYRSRVVEPLLIALLIGQIVIGVRLSWRWLSSAMDLHRCLQVASGAYVGAFVLTHLNSALISARAVRGIQTDWNWASGAPEGLIADAWNIRLLPHYAFGVFFILVHLCEGLRVVLLAHNVSQRVAERLCWLGLAAAAGIAGAIVAALCGVRV